MFIKNMQILFINISIILVIILLKDDVLSLTEWLNTAFYLMLVYLIVLLFVFTLKGGFYDGAAYSFRRFYHSAIKRKGSSEEWEHKSPLSTRINLSFYRIVRFQFLALAIICISLMIIYYSLS